LAYDGGLTHHEIAERTGVPLGTVKGRMRLGLQRLRQLLGEPPPAPRTGQRSGWSDADDKPERGAPVVLRAASRPKFGASWWPLGAMA
jgi:hypothetical protein